MTTTTRRDFTFIKNDWQNLGPAPMIVEAVGNGPVFVILAASLPSAISDRVGHLLTPGTDTARIIFNAEEADVYVRGASARSAVLITPLDPEALGFEDMAGQSSRSVAITGGTVAGISVGGFIELHAERITLGTPLALEHGGTGGTDPVSARNNLGLDKVTNVAPDDLPVSKATREAISQAIRDLLAGQDPDSALDLGTLTQVVARKAEQADLSFHVNDRTNPHGVTKDQVGLGAVANLDPSAMPVSIAQAAADTTSRNSAISIAAADATTKANNAQTNATTTAAADATAKAQAVTDALNAAIVGLKGSVSVNGNTLAKLEALILAVQQVTNSNANSLSSILAGSSADVDTFIETYNRFLANESAAAAMNTAISNLTTTLGQKANASDLAAKANVSDLAGKANQSDLAILQQTVTNTLAGIAPDPIMTASVQPTLDLLFGNSEAVLDDVFTRASSGSRVTASGLLETIPAGYPRITRDPLNSKVLGALFESTAVNLVTTSAGVANAYAQANTTLTAGVSAGPFGTLTLTRIQATAAGTSYCQIPYNVVTAADGVTRTLSGYIRQGNTPTTYLEMEYGGGTFTSLGFNIDWAAKTIAVAGALSGVSCSLTNCGGGLYRFALTSTNTYAQTNACLLLVAPRGGGITGQQAGDYVFVGDIQLEVGTRATSYITTSGAAATRQGDVLAIPGEEWLNPNEGTAFVEFWYDPVKADLTQYQRIFQLTGLDGTFQNTYSFTCYPGGNLGLSCQRNGTFVGDLFTSPVASRLIQPGLNRAAFSYGPAGVTVSFNGVIANFPTFTAVPAFKGIEIGAALGLYQPNCPISRASYFPRQLTDTLLSQMTVLS